MKLRKDRIKKYPFVFFAFLVLFAAMAYVLVFMVGQAVLGDISNVSSFHGDAGLQMEAIALHGGTGLVVLCMICWELRHMRGFFFSSGR